jgi:DNA repair protein RecO (recombination protein O)
MSLVEIVAYYHEQRKVHRLKEVRLEHVFASIPFDMRKSAVVTCIGEICSKCITTADPHPELFAYIHALLTDYDDPAVYDPDFLIRFLVGLTHYLGFGMDVSQPEKEAMYFDLQEGLFISTLPRHPYLMSVEDTKAIQEILDAGPSSHSKLTLDVRRRIVDQLITYYQLHVESLREVNSIRVLRELL